MRALKFLTVLAFVGSISGCGDEGDVTNIPFVSGTVGGSAWQLQYGKASLSTLDRELELELFSQAEVSTNACLIVTTNNAHLRMTTPSSAGNYTIPGISANLFFEQSGSLVSFQATSGFIEITEVVGNRVSGILQADFDEDNRVEGRFIAEICN